MNYLFLHSQLIAKLQNTIIEKCLHPLKVVNCKDNDMILTESKSALSQPIVYANADSILLADDPARISYGN